MVFMWDLVAKLIVTPIFAADRAGLMSRKLESDGHGPNGHYVTEPDPLTLHDLEMFNGND